MKKKLSTLFLFVALSSQLFGFGGISLESSPSEAEIFAEGIVSTWLYERDIAISPKADEIIFTLTDYRRSKMCLVRVSKIGEEWSRREILDFSGEYADIEPCFAPDGRKLYFASNRPMNTDSTKTDFNIWVSERKGVSWSEPEPLPSIINTEFDEFYPSVCRNGNLYFTSVRENGIGNEDIFISRYIDGAYTDPRPLDTNINTPTYEFNSYVSPDEDLIVFSSFGRDDELGGGDLYYSAKDQTGNWNPAENMGEIVNSEYLDYCPFIDFPRNNFYFTSERFSPLDKKLDGVGELENFVTGVLNGLGNIYVVSFYSLDFRQ
ncbi:MAG: PD40 domain-containing protein [Candidatus Latescibacteria bacterium]|nr:PD40 domain-containing protein [Candidatus Latescibacterota bacterium]